MKIRDIDAWTAFRGGVSFDFEWGLVREMPGETMGPLRGNGLVLPKGRTGGIGNTLCGKKNRDLGGVHFLITSLKEEVSRSPEVSELEYILERC